MTGLRRKETNYRDKIPTKCSVCEREFLVNRFSVEHNLATHGGKYVCSRCGKKFAGWDKNARLLQKIETECDQCGRKETVLALTVERRKEKHGKSLCIRCVQSIPAVKEKRKATCQIRFGGNAATVHPAVQKKRRETCLKKYSIQSYTEISRLFVNNPSTSCQAFFEALEEKTGLSFECEKWIDFRVQIDGFHKPTKTVIEFYGSYWHCDPSTWGPKRIHPHKKISAEEVWRLDEERKSNLEKRGYRVLIVWESEYLADSKGTLERIAAVFG